MDLRMISAATRSRYTSTICDASSVHTSLPMSKDAVIASTADAKAARPWSLRRRMAIAVAAAACMVFLILGLLVYQALPEPPHSSLTRRCSSKLRSPCAMPIMNTGRAMRSCPLSRRRRPADTIRRCLPDRHRREPVALPLTRLTASASDIAADRALPTSSWMGACGGYIR